MTSDLLICKIAGVILLALFLVLARLLTVTKQAAAPPELRRKLLGEMAAIGGDDHRQRYAVRRLESEVGHA